uniref:Uncharacterized protein n=1 Tax=Sphaeramia orbicularis TaxID=375764 RepID=A0A673BXK9_9TELE
LCCCFSSRSKLFTSVMCCYDTVSASSNMDMEDRVSHLEQRLQLQEDEIQLLKAALADALRRLGYCEETQKFLNSKLRVFISGSSSIEGARAPPPVSHEEDDRNHLK